MSADHVLTTLKADMEKAKAHIQQSLHRIRAGRATPELVAHIRVEYYGSSTPLSQVASVTSPDARSIHIKPWEKDLISEIERAIQESDLGFHPQNNGEHVILSIPPLTEERRKQVIKQARQEVEQGRIRIRALRKDSNERIKKDETLNEDEAKLAALEVQKLTDAYISAIDELMSTKEKEILQI